MFLDEAHITVHGGLGGNGLVSWRKEKFVDRGGPWGGDGGNGGNVVFRADANTDTLTRFSQEKVFRAEEGERGGKARCHGKNGEDLVLLVPPGTTIHDANNREVLADLSADGQETIIALGGRGGYGNAHFASSTRQAPDFAEKGDEGQTRAIHLELKLVADVGIIGFPSVGKSMLISVVSNAKPKIADYPFTTLVPNLGIVPVHDRYMVLCDIPGLIEGASEGKGLGDKFLRHIERCGVLLHVLDISRDDIVSDYAIIRAELERHSPALAKKRELVILNKCDLVAYDITLFEDLLKKNGIEVFASISAATHKGTKELMSALLPIVLEERSRRSDEIIQAQSDAIPVLRPQVTSDRADAFTIQERDDGFLVSGKRIEQIASMTDWNSRGGVHRFRDIADRCGLKRSLLRMGATHESTVYVGKTRVTGEWIL